MPDLAEAVEISAPAFGVTSRDLLVGFMARDIALDSDPDPCTQYLAYICSVPSVL